MNTPYSDDALYRLINDDTLKMLNSDEFKKDLIEKCFNSYIASDIDKYDNFTNTYYYILLMHLNIFINDDNENENIEDFINYICIYLLLQAFFSSEKILKSEEKTDIVTELYKNIIIMLKIACDGYENENNNHSKIHMKKISEYLFELNNNNKINDESIKLLNNDNINNVNLKTIKEIKLESLQINGGAAPGAADGDGVAPADNDAAHGDGAAPDDGTAPVVAQGNTEDNTEDNKKNVILLNAFKIKMINEIMFFSEYNLKLFKNEYKSFLKKK